MKDNLKTVDPELFEVIQLEEKRQENNIELIASENFVSKAVLEAQGSVLTNKYAEGYPGHRYYGGCEYVDMAENLAIERVKKLFGAKYANVQPHSGSQANAAAYQALIQAGDTVLGMDLSAGGHLTHGSKVNFSGKNYHFVSYGVDRENEMIDYNEVRNKALEYKPKLIVAGASAYSRFIDFEKFRAIADEVGAYLMVDMAHIAGLIATGLHPNPIPYADVVTSTTHKTLRGPRGGLILTNDQELAKKINSAIFPGTQGGPLEHVIAAKAVAFKEDLEPAFKEYSQQILNNVKAMEDVFKNAQEARLVAGGSDNHLLLIDVTGFGLTGKEAEEALDLVGITVNKNAIPFETKKPTITSGIRIGTPAITTRGFKEEDAKAVAEIIVNVLRYPNDKNILEEMKENVLTLTNKYPLPYGKNN